MNILLIPLGSYGDVHPFLGLGNALRARGHQVTLITNGHFRPLAEARGFAFHEMGTEAEYLRVIADPDLWRPIRGPRKLMAWGMTIVRPLFDLLARIADNDTLVVAAPGTLGSRLAQEKLGLPTASVVLQPLALPSIHAPLIAPGSLRAIPLPLWSKRFLFKGARWLIDRMFLPTLAPMRRDLGLPLVRGISSWYLSPELILGLWPSWFAPPQPDWPKQVQLTGFPLFDESDVAPLPPEAHSFLEDMHGRLIVFTPGSANQHAARFFMAAADACAKLNRPALFLTRFPEQVPRDLPSSMRAFPFLPLSQVLPHAAALAHHGGIGTVAQGLAHGVPQLLMPMAYDQPENAHRLRRMGVAQALSPQRFTPENLTPLLRELLENEGYRRQSQACAQRLRGDDAVAKTCLAIEGLKK